MLDLAAARYDAVRHAESYPLPGVSPLAVSRDNPFQAEKVVLRRLSAVALEVAPAMVAPDVYHVPLSLAVAPVHVGGGDGEARRRLGGDLDFQAVSVLGQLVPELRDSHHHAAGPAALDHTSPGL